MGRTGCDLLEAVITQLTVEETDLSSSARDLGIDGALRPLMGHAGGRLDGTSNNVPAEGLYLGLGHVQARAISSCAELGRTVHGGHEVKPGLALGLLVLPLELLDGGSAHGYVLGLVLLLLEGVAEGAVDLKATPARQVYPHLLARPNDVVLTTNQGVQGDIRVIALVEEDLVIPLVFVAAVLEHSGIGVVMATPAAEVGLPVGVNGIAPDWVKGVVGLEQGEVL